MPQPDVTKGFAVPLASGLKQLNLTLPAEQQESLCGYLAVLDRWNRSYNLTAIHPSRWVSELLLDALVALPFVTRGPGLGVGSVGCLPGIPVGSARRGLAFTLLDSNGKKTRFIRQIIMDLQIPNVDVVQSRVEAFQVETGFATITSRAFAALSKFLSSTSHLLAAQGEWLAWKGENVDNELASLPATFRHLETLPVVIPGVSGQRYLIRLTKTESTNQG